MKKSQRIGLGIVGLVAVLAMAGAPAAKADGFAGTFRGPHGEFSIHIGSPSYPIGSYAPYGRRVYRRDHYGYGFDSPIFSCRTHRIRHAHWIPVRRHHTRWLVVERPIVVVDDGRYYGRGYRDDYRYSDRYDGYDRYDRYDRYDDGRRYERYDDRRDYRDKGKRRKHRRGWRD
jgi:hypothetical protein